jgi:hypothetical protein
MGTDCKYVFAKRKNNIKFSYVIPTEEESHYGYSLMRFLLRRNDKREGEKKFRRDEAFCSNGIYSIG